MPSARELEKGENQQSISGTHEAELACQVEKPGWKSEQLVLLTFLGNARYSTSRWPESATRVVPRRNNLRP